MLSKVSKSNYFFLGAIIILSIFIRSLNFPQSLNFSTDQALFSVKSLEILRGETKGVVLIGPPISLKLDNKDIYQGGIIYYTQALFLLLGNLDPITSSYLFMIFSSLMIIPLFYGVKFLTSSDKAKFVILLYGLTPLFINYTKFLWNPNFQLSLLPLLFLFLGLYKKQTKNYWLILSGIWFGLILQFHYQLIIGGILLLFYMYFHLKLSGSKIMLFLLGSIIGFLPIIIYELQHNFPNLKTLLFYSQNFKSFNNSNSGIFKNQHYFLSLSLITAIIIVSFLKRLSTKIIYTAAGLLLVMDLFLYIPKPTHGFGMAENWNYLDEQKAFEIIKNENLKGYNITNLNYDTLATVQKYLQKKENMDKNLTDYWETDKMFVISPNTKNINTDPTYEIQVVRPFEIIHTWPLNANNTLFLLKRM